MTPCDWSPTCGDNDSPLIGRHVGGRGVLLVHVVSVVHLRYVVGAHQFIAFADTAVHWGLSASCTHAHTHTHTCTHTHACTCTHTHTHTHTHKG